MFLHYMEFQGLCGRVHNSAGQVYDNDDFYYINSQNEATICYY